MTLALRNARDAAHSGGVVLTHEELQEYPHSFFAKARVTALHYHYFSLINPFVEIDRVGLCPEHSFKRVGCHRMRYFSGDRVFGRVEGVVIKLMLEVDLVVFGNATYVFNE